MHIWAKFLLASVVAASLGGCANGAFPEQSGAIYNVPASGPTNGVIYNVPATNPNNGRVYHFRRPTHGVVYHVPSGPNNGSNFHIHL